VHIGARSREEGRAPTFDGWRYEDVMRPDHAANERSAPLRCQRFLAWCLVGLVLIAVAGCRSAEAALTPKAHQLYLGDFDGDGTEDRLYYTMDATDDLLSTSHGNFAMSFPTGAIPKIGDFDGDGVDDVLFFIPGSADQRIWYFGASTGTPSYKRLRYLGTGDTPIVGNFDGNPGDEILWYGPASITDSLWFFDSQQGLRIQGVGRGSGRRSTYRAPAESGPSAPRAATWRSTRHATSRR
jgi:hypothetical protein